MELKNAYECREEFNARGRCVKRERAIGPIVVWSVVALVALYSGQGLVTLPPAFWEFFKK